MSSFLPPGLGYSAESAAAPQALSSTPQAPSGEAWKAAISGAIVPCLTLDLAPGETVYFEHDTLLWKSVELQLGSRLQLSGMFKRLVSGMDLIITEAAGPGRIALSRDVPGEVRAFPLAPGQEIQLRERAFLAASNTVDYTWERAGGIGTMILGGTGLVIDRFRAGSQPGVVWVHGGGNIIEMELGPGQQIDVEAGGWLYKEPSVGIELRLAASFLASVNLFCTRLTGPGRIGIQTLYHPSGTSAAPVSAPETAQQAAIGAVAGVAGSLLSSFFGGQKRE
jgi:uncharacterized protein (AIM24 family)